ncbi:MAG TPA: helix-turn-helix transcriptional regulator [Caulobacteraceae bacterium]|nr:helix-turn-helix transcriptional regulator [Caulobacteraceae bacterium]
MTSLATLPQRAGDHIREWRQRRRMSQLELALEADISTRHLSFVETGRAQPSRRMILALADRLDIPMRERNRVLMAGGFAPQFPERDLAAPEMSGARQVIDVVLKGHLPYPAFAVDRRWNILASNQALPRIYEGVAEELLTPPVNGLRLSLHPRGMAPRIINLGEWRAAILARVRSQMAASGDADLAELYAELKSYGEEDDIPDASGRDGPLIPFRLASEVGPLSFLTTTMVFDSPLDVTLSELIIECFFPADAETATRVRAMTTDA